MRLFTRWLFWIGFGLTMELLFLTSFPRLGLGAAQAPARTILHSLRGKVLMDETEKDTPIRVSLRQQEGPVLETLTLKYDGGFAFEELAVGNYLLVIEHENSATVARPVQIKSSSSPKTLYLLIRLTRDGSATITETVKDYSRQDLPEREEAGSTVSRKALKEFQKAGAESAKGNPSSAIQHLQKAIALEPGFYEAHNNLGVQYQRLHQWEKAVDAFKQAIAVRQNSVKAHLNLGASCLSLQQLPAAIAAFERALQLEPNSVIAHQALGRCYFEKKDFEAAREHLEMATRLAPKECKPAFLLMAQMYLQQNEPAKARGIIDTALEYFPNDQELLKFKSSY